MAHAANTDVLNQLARRLRADNLFRDAEVIAGPEPTTVTALVVPQGFRPGPELRQRALQLAGDLEDRLQIMLMPAIPRHSDSSLDVGQALLALRRPGTLLRYEPPVTDTEVALAHLVGQVLPDLQASMTDTVGELGADSIVTIELTTLIAERFGAIIDPQTVFRAESLGHLASLIDMAIDGGDTEQEPHGLLGQPSDRRDAGA